MFKDGQTTTSQSDDARAVEKEIASLYKQGKVEQVSDDLDDGYDDDLDDLDEAVDEPDDIEEDDFDLDEEDDDTAKSEKVDLGDFKSTAELKKAYDELRTKDTKTSQQLADTNKRLDALYQRMGIAPNVAPEIGIGTYDFQNKLSIGIQKLRAYYQNLVDTDQMAAEDANYYLREDEIKLENGLKSELQQNYEAANLRVITELRDEKADILAIKEVQDAANYFAQDVIKKGEYLDKQAFSKLLDYGQQLLELGKKMGVDEYRKSKGLKPQQEKIRQRQKTQAGNKSVQSPPSSKTKLRANMSQADFNKLDDKSFTKMVHLAAIGKLK